MIKFVTLGVPGYHRLWRGFPTASARITNFLLYANGGSVGSSCRRPTPKESVSHKRVSVCHNPLITFVYQLIYPNYPVSVRPKLTSRSSINFQAKVIKVWAHPRSLATTNGIIGYFLFLWVLRCFSSPAYRSPVLYIQTGATRHNSSEVSPFGHLRIKA